MTTNDAIAHLFEIIPGKKPEMIGRGHTRQRSKIRRLEALDTSRYLTNRIFRIFTKNT